MTEDQKKKIADLRSRYLDADSVNMIDEMEAQFLKLVDEAALRDHPVFKEIAKDAQKKLDEINALLQTDENIGGSERSALFAQKRVWKFVSDRFGFALTDRSMSELNKLLDDRVKQ